MKLSSTCTGRCIVVPTLKISCVVVNKIKNIARWIILFALCVDIRLILSLHHQLHYHDHYYRRFLYYLT